MLPVADLNGLTDMLTVSVTFIIRSMKSIIFETIVRSLILACFEQEANVKLKKRELDVVMQVRFSTVLWALVTVAFDWFSILWCRKLTRTAEARSTKRNSQSGSQQTAWWRSRSKAQAA